MRSISRANPCLCTTALGLPEVPDEWHQKAGVSSSTQCGWTGVAAATARRPSSTRTTRSRQGEGVSSAFVARITLKPASSRM